MRNRVSQSNKHPHRISHVVAALLLLITAAATAFCYFHCGWLTLRDGRTGQLYRRFPVHDGDTFSVGFIHSVNKSPLTDFYELRDGSIFVEKTVYYGFGAGVQTELEEGQTLEYGEDGSMIISGFDLKLSNLIYRVGTVSDHILTLEDGTAISLRDLCGRSTRVGFRFEAD